MQMQRDIEARQPRAIRKLIAPAVLAIVILVLILQNTSEDWRFHFFFWWFSLPAWLMLVCAAASSASSSACSRSARCWRGAGGRLKRSAAGY